MQNVFVEVCIHFYLQSLQSSPWLNYTHNKAELSHAYIEM